MKFKTTIGALAVPVRGEEDYTARVADQEISMEEAKELGGNFISNLRLSA